jgi:hypothetical protein
MIDLLVFLFDNHILYNNLLHKFHRQTYVDLYAKVYDILDKLFVSWLIVNFLNFKIFSKLMVDLIWDFNEFMSRKFSSLSMGLTPSGHLHLGFLSTLACALMYLKEHPKTHLIITNVENSLASKLEKYNGLPLRFQYLTEGELIIPKDYDNLKKRNISIHTVHNELKDLIWKLVQIFDENSAKNIKQIRTSFNLPKHKRFMEDKEHQIFHLFSNQVYVYSFLRILERDKKFRKNLLSYLTNYNFAKVIGPLCGIKCTVKNFGDQIIIGSKRYKTKGFKIPIRLYCPNCHDLCPDWAIVVIGHPYHNGPTFAAPCQNYGACPRADKKPGYDGYVYHNIKDSIEMAEFHFMLDPIRDFFDPFKADCHIFGGDYFQLKYELSGMSAIDKIEKMFTYLESITGQSKSLFGGPLITIEGRKMSKSGTSFNLKNIKKIKPVFLNIVRLLEQSHAKAYPKGMVMEYSDIIGKKT